MQRLRSSRCDKSETRFRGGSNIPGVRQVQVCRILRGPFQFRDYRDGNSQEEELRLLFG